GPSLLQPLSALALADAKDLAAESQPGSVCRGRQLTRAGAKGPPPLLVPYPTSWEEAIGLPVYAAEAASISGRGTVGGCRARGSGVRGSGQHPTPGVCPW